MARILITIISFIFSLFFFLKNFSAVWLKVFKKLFTVDKVSLFFIILNTIIYLAVFNLLPKYFKNRILTLLFFLLNLSFILEKWFIWFLLFELRIGLTFFIILIFGLQPERLEARYYFIIYRVVGSFPLICKILYINNFKNFLSVFFNKRSKDFFQELLALFFLSIFFLLPCFFSKVTYIWWPSLITKGPCRSTRVWISSISSNIIKVRGLWYNTS